MQSQRLGCAKPFENITISTPRRAPVRVRNKDDGGETGIRTLGRVSPTTVFETAPFDHSGTSPQRVLRSDRVLVSRGATGNWRPSRAPLPFRAGGIQAREGAREAIMLRVYFAILLFMAANATAAHAQAEALYRALDLPSVVRVMAEEGRRHGDILEGEMFPERGGQAWGDLVRRLYDPVRMEVEVRETFLRRLSGTDVGPLLDYFRSALGRRIVGLEVSARQALLDPEVERMSLDTVEDMRRRGDPRLELLRQFVEANDLIELECGGRAHVELRLLPGARRGWRHGPGADRGRSAGRRLETGR